MFQNQSCDRSHGAVSVAVEKAFQDDLDPLLFASPGESYNILDIILHMKFYKQIKWMRLNSGKL